MALYICCGEGYSQRELSDLGMLEVSRSRGRASVWWGEARVLERKGMLLRRLKSPLEEGAAVWGEAVLKDAGMGVSGGT